ncbi:MAG: ABC transporter ATP-binding protein, partial [Acidobacteriota bacterium]
MIEVENLTKIYGTHAAIQNVSFQVAKGEILGLLGP